MSSTCAISSPGWNASRFATCWPLASRPPSGSSYAFARYTRPRLVKNSSQWCVVVTKKCSTTSSLRSCAPRTPLPPRRWARYWSERVRLAFGLGEQVPGAPDDDLDLVVDPVPDELVEAEGARDAVDEGEHVRAEGVLQLGVLVEVVQDHLRDGVPLEDDDDAQARLVGRVVAQVGDALHPAAVDELGDLDGEVVRVDLVGQLGDDEAGAALDLLHVDDRTH